MKRSFSKKQRIAIMQSAQGKCQICGNPLPVDWHCDHITPYSKGGITDVINGQALCPSCNLSKGNRSMSEFTNLNTLLPPRLRDGIDLYSWQEEALSLAHERLFTKDNKLFLTNAHPGTGKSIHAQSVFIDSPCDHVIILAPTTTMVDQWKENSLADARIQLKRTMMYDGEPNFKDFHGMVLTYPGMHEKTEALREFCYRHNVFIIADEIHHIGESKAWGESFKNSFEHANYILGLSGTPWASDANDKIAFVNYDEDPTSETYGFAIADYTYSRSDGIRDGVIRRTNFHHYAAKDLEYEYRLVDGVKVPTKKELKYETLEKAMKDGVRDAYKTVQVDKDHFKMIFREADRQLKNIRKVIKDAGGLIVALDKKAAETYQEILVDECGTEFPLVHYKEAGSSDTIKNFRTGKERWLISVKMVTEGVDIKRLYCLIFLSAFTTELFFIQIDGRNGRRRFKKVGRDEELGIYVTPEMVSLDEMCHMYYTSHPEINKIVDKLEQEEQLGLKARKLDVTDTDENNNENGTSGNGAGSGAPPPLISTELLEATTEYEGLKSRGYNFDLSIVTEAKYEMINNPYFKDLDLSVICIFVKAKREEKGESNPVLSYTLNDFEEDEPELSNEDKLARKRKRIDLRIKRKVGGYVDTNKLDKKKIGQYIRESHKAINAKVGMRGTDDGTSLEQLERKLEFIITTPVKDWGVFL